MLYECVLGERIYDVIKRKELVGDANLHMSSPGRNLLSFHSKGHRLIVPREIKEKFTKGGLREKLEAPDKSDTHGGTLSNSVSFDHKVLA